MQIGQGHPLRRLFDELVFRRVYGDAGVRQAHVAFYVSGILADFTHVDHLYRIRNARGKRLEQVGEMLIESNPALGTGSVDREREIRKHIGDYTLFFSGLFPEYVASLPRRGLRLDGLVDYVQAGKESYRIVAARGEADLFGRLADSFELCVYGLNLVRQDLARFQRAYYDRLRIALDS